MLRLQIVENGKVKILKEGNIKDIVEFLRQNKDLYEWILAETPDAEMPDLDNIDTVNDLRVEINEKLNYSWWVMQVLENVQGVWLSPPSLKLF